LPYLNFSTITKIIQEIIQYELFHEYLYTQNLSFFLHFSIKIAYLLVIISHCYHQMLPWVYFHENTRF
jgi:hypothetical protein